nr:hypothetical protein [Photobacterium galatheae]
MPHRDYIEMTENETYANAKRKWLIFRGDPTLSAQPQSSTEPSGRALQNRHSRQQNPVNIK